VLITFNISKPSAKHDMIYEVLQFSAPSYATLVPSIRIIVPVSQV